VRQAVQTVISTLYEAHVSIVYVVHIHCGSILWFYSDIHKYEYNELQILIVIVSP
jgi:hypothetical protein